MDGGGEFGEDLFGCLPADTGIRHGLSLGEVFEVAVSEALIAFDEVGLDHDGADCG